MATSRADGVAQAPPQLTFQSLCDLLKPFAGPAGDTRAAISDISRRDLWTAIVERASAELVVPQLAAILTEEEGALPPDVAAYFAAVKQLSTTRTKALRDQLYQMLPALNEAGIVPLLLKGAAYEGIDLYPAYGARAFSDLDLLIRPGQLQRATQVLQNLGYEATAAQFELGEDHHHAPPLTRIGSIAAIELHRHPLRWQCRSALTTEEMFASATTNDGLGGEALVPSTTHLAIHNILHAQVSSYRYWRATFLLRDALDLAAIAKRFAGQVDWTAVTSRLKAAGFESVTGFYAKAAFEIFSQQPPADIDRITKGKLAHAIWRRRMLGSSHALQSVLRLDQIATVGRRAIAERSLGRHVRAWSKLALNRLVAARANR